MYIDKMYFGLRFCEFIVDIDMLRNLKISVGEIEFDGEIVYQNHFVDFYVSDVNIVVDNGLGIVKVQIYDEKLDDFVDVFVDNGLI